ncbi:MAG: sigma-70 family RNA polymerase sigma factor [Candidatus Obscuribacterales bacterium]|nr:sigma-70 family RNA polymerase sigma factor [Candidatus Obscuribacterales bacterium]
MQDKPDHLLFEEMTFCYMKQLFRLAVARVGNSSDAEDIVQETYLKAFHAFGSFKEQSHVKTWLTRILINTANDHFRKIGRMVPIVNIEEEIEVKSVPGPEEQLCNKEIDSDLLRALKTLAEPFLTPLILKDVYEASYEEIAQILDIPKGTVMSRLSRARAKLRENLTAHKRDDNETISRDQKKKRGRRYELR